MRDGVETLRLSTGITVPSVTCGDPAGTPVVLLHAWAESMRAFDRLRPLLPTGLRVHAWDQRGHGAADKPPGGYSVASLAEDTVAYLDAARIERAVILGASSGGYVGQQVAVTHPDRVAALVLVGSPLSLESEPPFMAEVAALTDPIDAATVRAFNSSLVAARYIPDWYLEDRVDDGLAMPAALWRATLRGLIESPAPTRLGTIHCPTLVLWGAEDLLLVPGHLQDLHEVMPLGTVMTYADTGHLVLWERPDRVAADLVAFLASIGLGERSDHAGTSADHSPC